MGKNRNGSFARVRPLPVSALATLLLVAAPSWGQVTDTTFTGANNNDWSDAANWTSGLPGNNKRAVIDGGQSVLLNANTSTTNQLGIGLSSDGSLTVNAGTLQATSIMLLGNGPGVTGNLSANNSMLQTSSLYLGSYGTGTLNLSASTFQASNSAWIGASGLNGSGSVTLTNGSVMNVTGLMVVGDSSGSGNITASGASSFNTGALILADGVGTSANVTLTGSSTWTSSGSVVAGNGGTARLTLSGGSTLVSNGVTIASNALGNGAITISGAGSRLTSNTSVAVGRTGSGTLTVADGGVVSASVINIGTFANSNGVVNIGAAAGSPAVAAGGLSTPSIVFGAGSGTLNLNHNASSAVSRYDLSAALSGNGTINQLAGDTLLSGNSAAFIGITNVNGGSLAVSGTLGGAVNVGNGGLLLGNGTVGATTVASGGTLATDGTGTLTINGNLNLNNGATLRVSTTPTAAGKVAVNGNAQLGGNLNIAAGSGDYSSAGPYTLLSASGTVSGSFANVSNNFAFVTPTVKYTSNSVLLDLARNSVSYASVAGSPNQASVAQALTRASTLGSTSATFTSALSQIDTLSASQARASFDSLSGRAFQGLSGLNLMGQSLQTLGQRDIGSGSAGGFGSAFAMDRWLFASNETDRFDYQYTAAATMTDSTNGTGGARAWQPVERGGAWAQIMGGHGNTRSDGNSAGYTNNSSGMLVGADSALNEHWSAGAAYRYGNTRLSYSTAGDSAKVESHQVSVYGRYLEGDWSFKGVAGYGRNQYGTARDIVIGSTATHASASYRGDEIGVYLEGSYRIDRGSYVIEPLVSLQGTLLRQDGFSETGAGALGLNAQAQTSHSAVSMLGARWHLPLAEGKLQSELRAYWSHQWLDTAGSLNASFQGAPGANFQAAGLQQKRDGMVVGASLAGQVGKRAQLFLDYNLGVNDLQTQHSIAAGLKMKW